MIPRYAGQESSKGRGNRREESRSPDKRRKYREDEPDRRDYRRNNRREDERDRRDDRRGRDVKSGSSRRNQRSGSPDHRDRRRGGRDLRNKDNSTRDERGKERRHDRRDEGKERGDDRRDQGKKLGIDRRDKGKERGHDRRDQVDKQASAKDMKKYLHRLCDYLADVQEVIEDESLDILEYDENYSEREGLISSRAYYDSKMSEIEILRNILRGATATKNSLRKPFRKAFFTVHNYRLGIRRRIDSCDTSSAGYRYRTIKEREREDFFERDQLSRNEAITSSDEEDDHIRRRAHREDNRPRVPNKPKARESTRQENRGSEENRRHAAGYNKKELQQWRARGRPRSQ